MPKRSPDQWRYWSETNKIIGQQLRTYYQACTTEELPPRLLAALKKLDEETEASADKAQREVQFEINSSSNRR